jgi:hypothetical protein
MVYEMFQTKPEIVAKLAAKTSINDLKTIDEMFEDLKNSEQTKDIQKRISDLHQLRNETIESLNGLYVAIQRLALKKNKMIRSLKEKNIDVYSLRKIIVIKKNGRRVVFYKNPN